MKKIYKYVLDSCGEVTLPEGAKFLSAHNQRDSLCVWAEVETDNKLAKCQLEVVPTGGEPPQNMQFLGTVLLADGALVYHVYC